MSSPRTAALVALLPLFTACFDARREPVQVDAAVRPDSGEIDGGARVDGASGHSAPDSSHSDPPVDCNPTRVSSAALSGQGAVFAWSGDGVVSVSRPTDGSGYRIDQFDARGVARGPAVVLWTPEGPQEGFRVAVADDTLAVVDTAKHAPTNRPTCRFALARLDEVESIRAPERFSDEPSNASILNEANGCTVAALDDGFLLVWQQFTDTTEGDATVFGQRIALDGSEVGERIAIASGRQKPPVESFPDHSFVATDGARALVALAGEGGADATLVVIDGGTVERRALVLPGTGLAGQLSLKRAHDAFWFGRANKPGSSIAMVARCRDPSTFSFRLRWRRSGPASSFSRSPSFSPRRRWTRNWQRDRDRCS